MVVGDLRILGQVGTTIGLGLLFDTLVVRSFTTPVRRLRSRLSIGKRPYPAVNWVFSSKRPDQNPESRQKTPGDAPRDER
jgi:hypothetical protein